MNLKEIREELLQAAELIADYEQTNHYLDKDTAMVKIRRAYEALRFCEIDAEHPNLVFCNDWQQVGEQESDKEIEVEIVMSDWEDDESIDNENSEDAASEEAVAETDEQPEQEEEQVEASPEESTVEQEVEEPASEEVQEPAVEEVPEADAVSGEESVAEAVPEVEEPASEELPEVESVVEPTPEPAVEVVPEAEPVVEVAPEPVKPKRVVVEPSLFGDDEIWGRPAPSTSRRKIMSLYGDEAAEPKPRHRRKSSAVEPEPPVAAPKVVDVAPAVEEPEQKSEPQLPTEPGTVLADTIATPTTIADTIPSQPRVGESGAVDTLRSSISVGDRFMLIRELFGGNEAEYESTIDKLEEMDNLDDCIIYIAENFAWRASSNGAKLIMDLLQRKLC